MAEGSEPINIDEAFIAEFRRLKKKVDNAQGSAVTINNPDTLVIDSFNQDSPGSSDAEDPLSYLKLTATWSSTTPNMVQGNPCSYDGTNVGTTVLKLALFAPITSAGDATMISSLVSGNVVAYLPLSPKQTQGANTIDGICLPTSKPGESVGTATYQVKQMTSATTFAWQQIVLGT